MALYKPVIAGQLSGRVGGLIYSHNSGGQYVRVGTVPTNPNTAFQAAVRSAVATLSASWSSSMNQAQRDLWEVYADNVTVTNRVGDQIHISGLAHYVRSNTALIQAGLTTVEAAPTTFDLGVHSALSITNATVAGQTIDVVHGTGTFADPWANEVGGFAFSYFSRPQNPGIQFFKGPYRFAGLVTGDPVPPASPETIASPFVFSLGQRIFSRHFTVMADGRLSTSDTSTTLAVA